ncbi:hypothetical protein ACVIHH_008443 [Bradyrhizobium sp. USDA 4518]
MNNLARGRGATYVDIPAAVEALRQCWMPIRYTRDR